jgi:hypothetical protein
MINGCSDRCVAPDHTPQTLEPKPQGPPVCISISLRLSPALFCSRSCCRPPQGVIPPDSDSNEFHYAEACREAAEAGWVSGAPFGGWGSAAAAAAAAAAGWKGGASRGEEGGLGVTGEIEDSEHWESFPPHWVKYIKEGRAPGVPYRAYGGAPSGESLSAPDL